jgi:hypothetical protein
MDLRGVEVGVCFAGKVCRMSNEVTKDETLRAGAFVSLWHVCTVLAQRLDCAGYLFRRLSGVHARCPRTVSRAVQEQRHPLAMAWMPWWSRRWLPPTVVAPALQLSAVLAASSTKRRAMREPGREQYWDASAHLLPLLPPRPALKGLDH